MEESQAKTNTQETIRKTAVVLLRLMGFSNVTVALRQNSPEDSLTIAVSMDEAGILIGDHGANLRAFEFITKIVVRKILPDAPKFILDVNNYREERIAELREYARNIASRVSRDKQESEMEPMSGYERRVVHTELTSRPDITTESRGEGLERRVVVKPL